MQLKEAAAGIEKFGAMEGKTLIRLTPEEAAAFDSLAANVVGTVVAETGGNAQAIIDALKAG